VLPEGLGADIDLGAWELPAVFRWLRDEGGITQSEMLKTFNCGIGMVAVVAADRAGALAALLREAGETVHVLGHVAAGQGVAYRGALA
jgi:phosphoribosylformylglycinamidine cyclo-ligase